MASAATRRAAEEDGGARPEDASLSEIMHLATMGLLTASVAHEMRAPAAALSMLLADLRAQLAGVALQGSLLEDAAICVDRILRLIRDLQSATRRDTHPETFALSALLSEIVPLARLHAKPLPLEIHTQVDDVALLGRRDKVGQVLLNLLVNAVDACRERPAAHHRIDVTATHDGRQVVITVADTGAGIRPELGDVFRPFVTSKPRGQGTGLGLAICRQIVAEHHGRLDLLRSDATGTTFSVTLPSATSASIGAGADSQRPRNSRPRPIRVPDATTRRRLLVIDDDALVLRATKRSLAGHDVVLVDSVAQARALLDAAPRSFDLVLCDLSMPNEGGMDLAEWLRTAHPHDAPKLVFATGGPLPEHSAYIDASEHPCLLKPVLARDVLAVLEDAS
jgi:CheY-like chemotaxis protein